MQNSKLKKSPSNKKEKITDLETDIKILFRSPLGQKILKHLKSDLRFGETLYERGRNKDDLHFHLGRQSVINEIIHILNKEA